MNTRKLETLGSTGRRTEFSYSGSIHTGVTLDQTGKPRIDAQVFAAALKHFAGRTVYGGFKEDDPPAGGFGEWLQEESPRLNSRKLTPRHGSFVAAILCADTAVRSSLRGNSILLHFPAANEKLLAGGARAGIARLS
jgi:hypothetical protein